MAKKKKVKNVEEGSEKPASNQLKSINKVKSKKKKNKLLDNVLNQLKNNKGIKADTGAVVQPKNKKSQEKSNERDTANKQNSNHNDGSGKKKKRRKKNKKNKEEPSEKREAIDSNVESVQENGKSKKIKKRKKKGKGKNAGVKTDAANENQNGNEEDVDKSRSKKLLKRLNLDKLSSMLREREESTAKGSGTSKVKKRVPSPLSLRDRMMAQLKASRFRFLNEQMYSSDSSSSKKFFQDDPQAFYAYHEGYKHQVDRWPLNPLDVIIESIKKMPKDYIVADFGCGEAKLADSVPQKVHSFDLVAVNDKVQACDMANTPLLTGRTNVVVFCLSLMGSNLRDYLLEANRVLEKNGILKVAEVESRFDDIDDFIKTMSKYGFNITWKDLSNNLFYFLDFKKVKDVLKKDVKKLPEVTLKPCLYKKR